MAPGSPFSAGADKRCRISDSASGESHTAAPSIQTEAVEALGDPVALWSQAPAAMAATKMIEPFDP